MYPQLVRPLLFRLPAEAAHHAALWSLSLCEAAPGVARWHRGRVTPPDTRLATRVVGLDFPNPIGLAAGLDKDAEAVTGLLALGFGFVEVGTVTPRPQPGNPAPRLFRLPEHRALINRMGFNNQGAAAAAGRLRELSWRPAPIGVNLGKNKDTPLEQASEDYTACIDAVRDAADYFVVNASSPNTPGLRQLQDPARLLELLEAVRARRDQVAAGRPLFFKLAPDLAPEAVDAVVDVALSARVDGLIATNTTLERPVSHPRCAEAGGFSGAPLEPLATSVLRRVYRRAEGRLPIIGVGGVMTAEDAYRKLRAGASLVQVYTGFVYEGPAWVGRLVRGLAALLARDGFGSVSEAVGVDASAAG